jgi:hypothetical protein
VDSGRLRPLPRHRTEHLDGLCRSRPGARTRPDVRQVAGLATYDGPGLGKLPAATDALARNLFAICEYSTDAVQHRRCSLRASTALVLYGIDNNLGERR